MYEIREREVPEQLVLTEQRHLKVDELPGWLPTAICQLGRVLVFFLLAARSRRWSVECRRDSCPTTRSRLLRASATSGVPGS